MLSSVDFPAPDGPMIEMNSPGLMSALMRRRTYIRPAGVSNTFSSPRSEMSGPEYGVVCAGVAEGLVENSMGSGDQGNERHLARYLTTALAVERRDRRQAGKLLGRRD